MEAPKKVDTTRSIVLIPLLLAAAFIFTGFGLLDLYLKNTAVKRYEADLTRLAQVGGHMLELHDKHSHPLDFDGFADRFAESGRFRVTIIDADGSVLGDSRLSKEGVARIENHADRPEVIQARESGIGSSTRYSNTLKTDLLYVALRYSSFGRDGFFRVSFPLNDLKADLHRQRLIFGIFSLSALILFSIFSLIASRYILSLVKRSEHILEDRVEERTKQIEILQNIGTQLTVCSSVKEGLKVIQRGASVLLPRFSGAISLFRASKGSLEIVGSWNGEWKGRLKYDPGKCWSLRTGQLYFSDSASEKVSCDHCGAKEVSMLCIPVIAQGETYGVMHFSTPRDIEWTKEEYQLASAVAEQTSLTLANLKLRESLRHQAVRDPLTGLFNRRYLMETFENEISRASRRQHSLGVLMIDLDHFKQFNDEHGHNIGDFILSEFGRLIRLTLREEDTACRYGGEEFTILLPETDRAGASLVAEKLRKTAREHGFAHGNQSYGPITLSIGVSVFPDNGDNASQLIETADTALYNAKEAGRDRVVVADGILRIS